MIRPLECFIGLRYLGAVGGRGLVSFMSFASVAGIALGVAAIIVILSAMNGLEAEQRDRLLALSEHVTLQLEPAGNLDPIALAQRLAAVDGVVAVTPFVRLEGMLVTRSDSRPVVIRGVDPLAEGPDSELAGIVDPRQLASLVPGGQRLLLGRFLAAGLGLLPGDPVEFWLPRVTDGNFAIDKAAFVVANDFSSGVEDGDAALAVANLVDAGSLIGLDGRPQALAIRLEDPMQVADRMPALEAAAGAGLRWSNWAEENRSLYQAMAIEKTMMTILLMFVVAVAAFNIVASLTMVVNEKARDIAILRTIGLEPERVSRIFLVQGAVLGVGGTLLGVAIGLLLAANLETILPWLERTFGFQVMPGDVYYVNEVPSEIRPVDVLLIPGIALLLSLLATIYPSRRAARIEPAEVLRYE